MRVNVKHAGIAFFLVFNFVFVTLAYGQDIDVYPSHWFTGMKHNTVQLMLHGTELNAYSTVRSSSPNLKIGAIKKAESPNYLFIDVTVLPAANAGNYTLTLSGSGRRNIQVTYTIKAKRNGRGATYAQGVTSKDFIYLLMPDRFANGDPSNDVISTYKDQVSDRSNPSAHHGGDIQGVIDHLPYLQDLGVSSVWMCPVIENDMPWKQEPAGAISGYHGYWFTNHYEIDKRYGGNEAYSKLSNTLHERKMKLVQDAVYNHVGDEHFLYRDKPFEDMFNKWSTYTNSNHREEAVYSPYASLLNEKVMLDGWFTPHLPDVNQRNPYMANFLIQHAIWSTEEFGVDGWRVDTYKYCDEAFLNRINSALVKEFPSITIFGEAWCNTPTGSAYFTKNNMQLPFKHNAHGTTDFPMNSAMLSTLNEGFGWTNGINRLYNTLSQDVLYEDANRNCIFLDNHDMDRYMTMIGGDELKYRMGLVLLMTQRGIPQLYFGTEIMMVNDNVQGDGKKRNDFPGGFTGDAMNKFETTGRTEKENYNWNYLRSLAKFRANSKALTEGRMTDYIPQQGLYVYFKMKDNETVMVIINSSDSEKKLRPGMYLETNGKNMFREVTGEVNLAANADWNIPAKTGWVIEVK